MDWADEGIVLSSRKHGETSAIATLLTREHGVQAGLVRGGASKRRRSDLQPGNRVMATWRARLADHLGTFTVEVMTAHAAPVLEDADALAALSAAVSVTQAALPEREKHAPVYEGLSILLNALEGPEWPSVYVKWELGLLGELGFGLDLSSCAASGVVDELIYVSPKSGRAVSADAGRPYRKTLLALPRFLRGEGTMGAAEEICQGLALTGYFLERYVFVHVGRGHGPAARGRLVERLARRAKEQGG